MFVTDVNFTATGVTAKTADTTDDVRTSIGNRYEGSNVVFRDGFYYLFASATNCCNGALTGYSVFVGRSTSPYGPFLDREGNSFLQSNVGGTPFLTMNGNRWIGTGHNTVFEDEAGQWWTIYHAVDQEDPFYDFQTGFTKRPALLDPIDWVDGWPTVNGGAGASDTKMPAPAAQEGQRSRHKAKLVKPQVVNRLVEQDEFNGTSLDGRWDWVREPASGVRVADGVLRFDVQAADLFVDNNSASVLVRDAPKGDYVVETKVRIPDLPAGCCFNFTQAGLVVYGDDDNFVKLSSASLWETRQTEFAKEVFPVPEGWSRYGNTVVGAPGIGQEWTWLRIVVERLSGEAKAEAGGDTERYTAYTSQDGQNWVRGGAWTHSLGQDAQIGLIAFGEPAGQDFTAEFDHVRVYSLKGGPRGS
jgi:arabinan endo-1,5-alpha-L-arabinosidase